MNWALIGILFVAALIGCVVGFKEFVWFMSVGYGLAIAAVGLVLGIVSLCFVFVQAISIICGIVGIVFGAYALVTRRAGRGMAIAGFVCSIVGVSLSLLIIVLGIIGIMALF